MFFTSYQNPVGCYKFSISNIKDRFYFVPLTFYNLTLTQTNADGKDPTP